MLADGGLRAGVDVKSLESSIQTSAPDVDGILEGASQHRMPVAVLQLQVVVLKIEPGLVDKERAESVMSHTGSSPDMIVEDCQVMLTMFNGNCLGSKCCALSCV